MQSVLFNYLKYLTGHVFNWGVCSQLNMNSIIDNFTNIRKENDRPVNAVNILRVNNVTCLSKVKLLLFQKTAFNRIAVHHLNGGRIFEF